MGYPFEQAKHYSVGRGNHQVRQIFIHTAEDQKLPGAARRLWNWFAGKTSPQASTHFIVDAIEIKQSVKTTDTAWAVNDWLLNQTSLSIEMCCAAKDWTSTWYEDAYLVALLDNTANLTAQLCHTFGVPDIKLFASQLLLGTKGIAGHWDVTIAKKVKGGHTDPGKGFPWHNFIELVGHHLATIR